MSVACRHNVCCCYKLMSPCIHLLTAVTIVGLVVATVQPILTLIVFKLLCWHTAMEWNVSFIQVRMYMFKLLSGTGIGSLSEETSPIDPCLPRPLPCF